MRISRAFRIGKPKRQQYPDKPYIRPILVSFSEQSNADSVMENAKLLKNTKFGLSRDYPKEIREARQELWHDYKDARSKYGPRNVKLKYPAALEVNGETLRNLFPGWHSILRGSRNSNVESRVNETYTRAAEKSSILARDETLIEEETGDDTDSIQKR
ncbi:uncharacterized protein LOC132720552 [Ruditapes philippinarum]|uniref:uncharacterized protein LOC132720552 n=1 Tax=Ruditapes philippinarum TaxID=129788 RepID=UPI00295C1C06|nr:uncharacterized protein LOC132720552 [Ruditapes philippinarum]